ncbi:MAG: hypothetical protein K2L51_01795, partial [Clostridiales bacterium]|nr:hypothetical protein [Clostridiales bacterium]
VYVCELCFTALLLLPCLIAAGVVMHVSALYYVLMPLAVLFTPAVPLFLASIISIPIMYVVSFFRNRGAWGSILVLVLFGGFFVAYFIGVRKMQNVDPAQLDLSGVQHIFENIADTVYPLYAIARAMTGANVFGLGKAASTAVNLAVGVGCIAALGALALLISAAVYKRGAAKQLEGGKQHKAKALQYRSSGATKALMQKEWREIVRTPSFALNCLLGIVMCPIVAAFIGLSVNVTKIANEPALTGEPLSQFATQMLSVSVRLLMLWMILFMSVGTNGASPTAFSREGDKFCFCKLLPVDMRTQVRAKSYVHMAVGGISAVLGVIVSAIVNFDISFFLCSLVFMLLVVYASVHFGIYLDILSPKLKWVTPNEVMKHNRTVLTFMLGSLGIGLVLMASAFGIYFALARIAAAAIATAGMWAWLLIAALVAATVSHKLLYKNCERLIDQVNC